MIHARAKTANFIFGSGQCFVSSKWTNPDRKMRIQFDGRVFQFQKAGGINRYFAEIISSLPSGWTPSITGALDLGRNMPTHPNLLVKNPPNFRSDKIQKLFNRNYWCKSAVRGLNLAHPTYYDLTSNLDWNDFNCPVVLTVYDMILALYPRQMQSDHVVAYQRIAVKKADRIICISSSTENDLIKLMPEALGKTQVIHLGSSFEPSEQPGTETDFEVPTFLFVGGRAGYKNFSMLLRAFARAAEVLPSIKLNVAGSPLNSSEMWEIFDLGIDQKIVNTIYPDENKLRALYERSVGLLYPSRYEGFGLPPIEAMACGTIPVTSNSSSLPEVLGDAGIQLGALDCDAWTDAILKLSSPFAERGTLLEKGSLRANNFTWTECTQAHLKLYKEYL